MKNNNLMKNKMEEKNMEEKNMKLPKMPYTKGIIGVLPGGGVEAFYEGSPIAVPEGFVAPRSARYSVVITSAGMLHIVRGRGSRTPAIRDVLHSICELTANYDCRLPKTEIFHEKNASGSREYLCLKIKNTRYSLGLQFPGQKKASLFRDKKEIPAYVAGRLARELLQSKYNESQF